MHMSCHVTMALCPEIVYPLTRSSMSRSLGEPWIVSGHSLQNFALEEGRAKEKSTTESKAVSVLSQCFLACRCLAVWHWVLPVCQSIYCPCCQTHARSVLFCSNDIIGIGSCFDSEEVCAIREECFCKRRGTLQPIADSEA